MVCRDANGKITSSELLDLWESRNLHSLQIPISADNYELQANAAIERIAFFDTGFAKAVRSNLEYINQNIVNLPSNIALTPPTDASPIYQKPGCPLEGMMYFDGTQGPGGKLVVDQRIFGNLQNETEKAAALLHEAVYKTLREADPYRTGAGSLTTRLYVGRLFSSNLPLGVDVVQQLPHDTKVYSCHGDNVDFYAFKHLDSGGQVVARYVFTRLFDSIFRSGMSQDSQFNNTPTQCIGGDIRNYYWADLNLPAPFLSANCDSPDGIISQPRFDKYEEPSFYGLAPGGYVNSQVVCFPMEF